jgi:methylthioribulose-1-phosphate dehydratase
MARARKKSSKAPPSTRGNGARLAQALANIGREFHGRGWALGTSGNYSAILGRDPLRLLITASGLDKSSLQPSQLLEIDETATVLRGKGKPSAESFLHTAVARARDAGCILHTHSVWSTILSDRHATKKYLEIAGYEMLKGLEGVRTHAHHERIPIFENSQDIPKLAPEVEEALRADPRTHAFLLRGHGLYTWGVDVAQARRHVEILEFLLEVAGRRELGEPRGSYA